MGSWPPSYWSLWGVSGFVAESWVPGDGGGGNVPQHEFLCGGRGVIAFCGAEDEIEADVAWKRV